MTNEYPCLTLLDMARIPDESFDRFLAELPALIASTRLSLSIMEEVAPSATDEEFLASIAETRWIDDDDHNYELRIISRGDDGKPDDVLASLTGTLRP